MYAIRSYYVHEEFLNDFYFLGRDEEHKSQYRKLVTGIAKTLERSDILLGSTPQIAEEGEKLGKTSLYFRNRLLVKHGQLFVKLFKERPAFKKKVIGYFSGSNTHDKDLDSIVITSYSIHYTKLYEQRFSDW